MGNEKKEYEIWIDEYCQTMGNITIDLSDSYYSSLADDAITISGDYKDWVYRDFNTHDNITLTGGGEEMLRVAPDGFYVRGVRVEADAKEAEKVYKAFKQWLAWANLSRNDEE